MRFLLVLGVLAFVVVPFLIGASAHVWLWWRDRSLLVLALVLSLARPADASWKTAATLIVATPIVLVCVATLWLPCAFVGAIVEQARSPEPLPATDAPASPFGAGSAVNPHTVVIIRP